ncbi:unnamed protein product [Chrysodeixis includens]|uniref:Uncharacterized protein n=1 Tax=Chrysodeixis includens TaxID=689277 RepID=A0A9P0C5E5_CHRIL|nr:unnamed protein product [Chrysodeixis includens]
MFVCAEVRPLTPEELQFRRRALRDAVICIGWMKLLSIFCYVGLFLLVHAHSKGKFATALQIMICGIIPPQIINGVLLFLGALEVKILALEIALCVGVLIAAYNTILGLMGGIYYIRTGFLTIHFMMSALFAILSLSIFTVLCHDVIVIYTFKTLVQSNPSDPQPVISTPINPATKSIGWTA